jgi:CcmD family protein
MIKYIFLLVTVLISSLAHAQSTIEMADQFRKDGKIYVVVAVVCIILIGLFVYLINLDKKIGKLEKELNQEED